MLWFPGIRNHKMQESTYFVKARLFLQKSCGGVVSIGENSFWIYKEVGMCGESVLRIRGSLNIPLKTHWMNNLMWSMYSAALLIFNMIHLPLIPRYLRLWMEFTCAHQMGVNISFHLSESRIIILSTNVFWNSHVLSQMCVRG